MIGKVCGEVRGPYRVGDILKGVVVEEEGNVGNEVRE